MAECISNHHHTAAHARDKIIPQGLSGKRGRRGRDGLRTCRHAGTIAAVRFSFPLVCRFWILAPTANAPPSVASLTLVDASQFERLSSSFDQSAGNYLGKRPSGREIIGMDKKKLDYFKKRLESRQSELR